MVAGRASAEISASFEKLQAPVSSFAIPPDSTSERTSSLVKNGLPSVASRSRRGQLVRDLRRPDERLDERAVLGGGEGPQRDRDEARVVREGLEHPDERMPLVGLRLAVAADDERRRGPQAPDDVLERLDRDLGAVQVVEDQDERLAAGDPRQRPGDELEDLDPVLGLLLLGRDRDARVAARRAERSSPISESWGKSAIRSAARSEKSGRSPTSRPGPGTGSSPRSARRSPGRRRSGPARRSGRRGPRIFRTVARFLSSSSSRVLPIPGSPATTANWPSPEIAAFRRR